MAEELVTGGAQPIGIGQCLRLTPNETCAGQTFDQEEEF